VNAETCAAEVEVSQAILRIAPTSQPRIPAVLGTIARFEIGPAVRGLAASYTDGTLRSLDAIHLATAQVLAAELGGSPVTFVTYDEGLLNAASNAALPTASPGT
jgi:predicted nucleic acid-binding protein